MGVLPVGKSNKTDLNKTDSTRPNKERGAQPRQALVVTQAASIATPHTQGGADAVSVALEHFPQLGIWQQELIEKADINHGILWRQCCERWRDNRYSIRNITGLIDSYHRAETQHSKEQINNGKNGHSAKRESHNERAARETRELIEQLTGQTRRDGGTDPENEIFKLPAAFGG